MPSADDPHPDPPPFRGREHSPHGHPPPERGRNVVGVSVSIEPVQSPTATAPLRPVKLGPPDVQVDRKPDGTIYLRSPHPLEPYPDKLTQRLEHWAQAAPDRIFLAQRAPDGSWRALTYAQMLAQVRAVAQALIQRKLSPERPIAILSGNDLEHATLGLAAMMIGVPYAPISVPYSLM